jgi:transglutaminase-like putative cysteine protease
MRYLLRYHAEYRYSGPVFDQHNVLRVTPATTPLQRVRGFRVVVEPSARTRTYSDYFGTEVVEFNVPGEHERLAITAEGEVLSEEPAPPPEGGWELTKADPYTSRGGEFLLRTGDEPGNGKLSELREAIAADSPRETVEALCRVIPQRFEYRKGATFVGSTVDDLLEGGAGVCQDFVHLSLILLRDAGIAARYVSGYLFAGAPAGQVPRGSGGASPQPSSDGDGNSVEVNTHAWVEALVPGSDGEEAVWIGADPTNSKLAGDQHVKIGHGRHYGDVAPIRGVYRGAGGTAGHEVSVLMTRLTS